MKTLVVYYSRTGTTRKVAEYIAQSLNADREQLREQTDRHGFWGSIKGGRDALLRRPSALLPVEHDPSAYDLVIVGSPVWAGTLCPAVRTYLVQSAAAIQRGAFFCTHGGGGASRSYSDTENLLGKPVTATVSLRDRTVKRGETASALQAFLDALKSLDTQTA